MLTAAAIVRSPGTNVTSGHPSASDSADVGSMLFAESFGEGFLLGGAVGPQAADGNPPAAGKVGNLSGVKAPAVESTSLTLGKPTPGAGPASGLLEGMTVAAKLHSQPMGGKATVLPSGKTALAEDALRTQAKIIKSGTAVDQKTAITGQAAAGATNDVTSGPQPDITEAAENTGDAEWDLSAALVPGALNSNVDGTAAKRRPDAAVVPEHEVTSTGADVKGHEGSAKAVKATRTEENADRAIGVSEVAGSAQTAATAQSVSPVANPQPNKASVVQEDTSVTVVSSMPRKTSGLADKSIRKVEGETVAAKSSDEVARNLSAPVDETATHKSESADKKVTDTDTDRNSLKTEDSGAIAPFAHLVHAEAESAVVPAGSVGAVAMHAAGPGVQAAAPGVHEGATWPGNMHGTEVARPSDAGPQMLQATPNSLEVGVASGTHGWLKIRAEMSGAGVVNASLSPASSSGQEMLHRDLPSLTAYLQSEHVAVHSVVVQPAAAAGAMPREPGGRMGGDAGGQSLQNGTHGGERRQDRSGTTSNRMNANTAYRGLAESRDEFLPPVVYATGRSWLSVRA